MSKTQEEQRGYAKVHAVCAEMNAIWRPTPNVDVGIDGQIEFLEVFSNVVSTGKILAVQVKSGPSYFKYEGPDYVKYYPEKRHRRYWTRVNVPMLLVLHDSSRDLTLFARVKHQLSQGGPIILPKRNVLSASSREQLLHEHEEDMKLIRRSFSAEAIIENFSRVLLRNDGSTEINGLHFLLACVHLGIDEGYFELRYRRLAGGLRAVEPGRDFSRHPFNEFVQRCVVKCWAYDLVESFEEEFDHYWYGLNMMPDITVPLTQKGHIVMNHLWRSATEYLVPKWRDSWVANVPKELAEEIANAAQAASNRLDASDEPGEWPL